MNYVTGFIILSIVCFNKQNMLQKLDQSSSPDISLAAALPLHCTTCESQSHSAVEFCFVLFCFVLFCRVLTFFYCPY